MSTCLHSKGRLVWPPPRGNSPKGCLLVDGFEKPAADVVPEWMAGVS